MPIKTCWALYFDGACEPCNPGGHATWGWVLYGPDGKERARAGGHACSGDGATNNVAEYAGLVAGLEFLLQLDEAPIPLVVYGDSRLVIEQVNGDWRCRKPHLQVYRDRAQALLARISDCWEMVWIPRRQNYVADAISRRVVIPRAARAAVTGRKGPKPKGRR